MAYEHEVVTNHNTTTVTMTNQQKAGMPVEEGNKEIKAGDLVCLRFQNKYGYSNTWWRVMFVDNDKTFIGKLERHHWNEYKKHKVGDCEKFDCIDVQRTYKEGEQFCYGDKITICECSGLCKNK